MIANSFLGLRSERNSSYLWTDMKPKLSCTRMMGRGKKLRTREITYDPIPHYLSGGGGNITAWADNDLGP